ncbi:hybrid sensor histidine kinase/response regulator [Pseudomonas mangiferae]|uniref:histidine kinase n=1 Tax=Pseudomonas mangiferae TaxID=2593654 RepID=A0A553GTK7_9PSED|nr:PAS domain-containing sensor histidine kinase [Pseudomonas mangiferae]TRX72796.1 PAS domain S-box protein [Pseudomonas mangiferae]
MDEFAFLPAWSGVASTMRRHGWSDSPLGTPDRWPALLRATLATMLNACQPLCLAYGPSRAFFCNDAYLPLLDRPLETVLGQPLAIAWRAQWADLEALVEATYDGRGGSREDMPRRLDRDGLEEDTWWSSHCSPLCDEQGAVAGLYCITQETTARVRALAALHDLNANLERQVEQRTRERDRVWGISRDLYLVCGFDGFLRSANPSWASEMGYAPETLVGRRFDELVHPEDRAATLAEVKRLIRRVSPDDFQVRVRRADGSYRWYSWTCTPEQDLFYASGRDVQRRRELEELLRQSQKMEAIGQLTGGIAHDFNNLLTGISGSLELLQRRLENGQHDNLERYTGIALSATQRAASLTHRLLAFARKQALCLGAVDVNGVVAGMQELLLRTLGEQVQLDCRLAEGTWPANTDANQLESALLNLAINARDAMPDGGRLRIETRNLSLADGFVADLAPGDYVVLSVADSGSGIPAELLDKVFDPFFTTKPIGQGTGLGLPMIYGYAKQSGGHVDIVSEAEHGTTVRLYLPRFGDEPVPAPTAAPAPHAVPGAGPSARGEHVLVVEDDHGIRALLLESLGELGYHVREASDAGSARRLLEGGGPLDLLVTDIGLPSFGGPELAALARRLYPALKVLFITGYTRDGLLEGLVLDGETRLLNKPFALHGLARLLRDLLDGRAS